MQELLYIHVKQKQEQKTVTYTCINQFFAGTLILMVFTCVYSLSASSPLKKRDKKH